MQVHVADVALCIINYQTKYMSPIQQYMANEVSHSADNKVWTFVNKPHTAIAHPGGVLDFKIGGKFTGGSPPTATAVLKNFGDDGFTVPPVPNSML